MSANKTCPSCGETIAAQATNCPHCRAEQEGVQVAASTSSYTARRPGWYRLPDYTDTLGFFNGTEFTGQVAPTNVDLDVWSLARGVALGGIIASIASGFVAGVLVALLR